MCTCAVSIGVRGNMKLERGRTLTVFLTFGMSLEGWAKAGLLSREVKLYQALHREGMNVQLVTYGGVNDRHWGSELDGIDVVPVYEYMSRPRTMIGQLIKSFVIPWVIKPYASKSDLFKTNQIRDLLLEMMQLQQLLKVQVIIMQILALLIIMEVYLLILQ